jgi:hypothetical protein
MTGRKRDEDIREELKAALTSALTSTVSPNYAAVRFRKF